MLVETPAIVTARFLEYENRVVVGYEVRDKASGKVLTRGRTIQMAVDARTHEGQLVSPRILFEKLGGEDPW